MRKSRLNKEFFCHISLQIVEEILGVHVCPLQKGGRIEHLTAVLRKRLSERFALPAQLYADKLPEGTQYAEAFEWNEYGAPLTDELIEVMTK